MKSTENIMQETIEQKLKISEAFLTRDQRKTIHAKSRSIDSLLAEMHHTDDSEHRRKTTSAIYMLQLEQRLGGSDQASLLQFYSRSDEFAEALQPCPYRP
jgi:hypothetical protein